MIFNGETSTKNKVYGIGITSDETNKFIVGGISLKLQYEQFKTLTGLDPSVRVAKFHFFVDDAKEYCYIVGYVRVNSGDYPANQDIRIYKFNLSTDNGVTGTRMTSAENNVETAWMQLDRVDSGAFHNFTWQHNRLVFYGTAKDNYNIYGSVVAINDFNNNVYDYYEASNYTGTNDQYLVNADTLYCLYNGISASTILVTKHIFSTNATTTFTIPKASSNYNYHVFEFIENRDNSDIYFMACTYNGSVFDCKIYKNETLFATLPNISNLTLSLNKIFIRKVGDNIYVRYIDSTVIKRYNVDVNGTYTDLGNITKNSSYTILNLYIDTTGNNYMLIENTGDGNNNTKFFIANDSLTRITYMNYMAGYVNEFKTNWSRTRVYKNTTHIYTYVNNIMIIGEGIIMAHDNNNITNDPYFMFFSFGKLDNSQPSVCLSDSTNRYYVFNSDLQKIVASYQPQ